MSGFIGGVRRDQPTLFPDCLDDSVAAGSAIRVVDAFLDGLDLKGLGFHTEAAVTGRHGYHPGMLALRPNPARSRKAAEGPDMKIRAIKRAVDPATNLKSVLHFARRHQRVAPPLA